MQVRRIHSTIGLVLISTLLLVVIGSHYVVQGAGTDSPGSDKQATKNAYQKGVDRANAGQFEEALELFKKARKEEPNNPDVLNMLAFSQRKTGKIDQAIENYQKALSLRPRFPEAREYLGEAYLQAALKQLKTLEEYGSDGEEQYRELKEAIKEAVKNLDGSSGETSQQDDGW